MIHGKHIQVYDHLRCIFIHIPKAAGTSIERALAQDGQKTGGHSFARSIRAKMPEKWSEYFTFSFTREPISRFISAYTYLQSKPTSNILCNADIKRSKDINDFTCNYLDAKKLPLHLIPQYKFISDESNIIVDRVFRYESINEDWETVKDILKCDITLPYLNKTPSTPGTVLSLDSRSIVSDIYDRDFELFNYNAR